MQAVRGHIRLPCQTVLFAKCVLNGALADTGRLNEGAQPAQKRTLDEFAQKYKLQDQDWSKQMMKKQK